MPYLCSYNTYHIAICAATGCCYKPIPTYMHINLYFPYSTCTLLGSPDCSCLPIPILLPINLWTGLLCVTLGNGYLISIDIIWMPRDIAF